MGLLVFVLSLLSVQFSYKPVILFKGFTEDPHLSLPTMNGRLGIQPRASRGPSVRVRQVGPEGLEGKGQSRSGLGLGRWWDPPSRGQTPRPCLWSVVLRLHAFPPSLPCVVSVLRYLTCT